MALPPGARRAPVLQGHWLLGSLAAVQADYLGTVLRAAREVGPVVRIDCGPPGWRATFFSVASPQLAAELLGQPDRYGKDEPGYREIRQGLGNGMLTSEGEVWLRQRRMLAPVFTRRRIAASYTATIVEEAQRLAVAWRDAADAGGTVDANADMLTLASRTIGRILFGSDMAAAIPQIMRAGYVNHEMMRRCVSPHPTPRWLPTPANRRLRDGLKEIRSVVDDLVAARRAAGDHDATPDMLGLLLAAQDFEGGGRLSDAEVTDQVLVFLLAGHDTTATTLACALVELARHPDWQQRVQAELQRELGDRPPAADDVPRLVWTGRVAREAMRLYPASHSLGRSPRADEVLGGYLIPAGSTVVVSSYALHRSPESWDHPDVFDPGRYDVAPGEVPGRQKHAWMAFGSGPHACVGAQLATVETTLVLATLLQRVGLTTPLTSVPVDAAMTLKPTGALPLRLSSRAGLAASSRAAPPESAT